ncbi:SHOCT domain-containing protein [Bifidobacterium sp. ESL0790]|uniref:SHOCT domain-containing protein n=1 Tax=Bifidobacterium sp. ESL0790 TaxID=2983233 RepID=UPI0023FA248D|nr:SHOCT domain-containing protein [Bifidobacterium sp. ESL0790]WEV72114.1 SHOCT domain-containing protein [Bifidobacterium sp. ESL0790]
MEVKGYLSSVSFDGENIDIQHSKMIQKSLGGEHVRIPVDSVVSVALRGVKLMTNGALSFSVLRPDGSETGHPDDAASTNGNPFTVLVTYGQRNKFNELINAINERIAATPRVPLENIDDLEQSGKQYLQKTADSMIAHFSGDDGTFLILNKNTIENGGEKQSLAGVTARLEMGSDLQSRVTMTRLLALGVFAFAAKKKKGGERYLTIEGPDFMWATEVNRKKISKAEAFAVKVNNQAKQAPVEPAAPEGAGLANPAPQQHAADSTADILAKLAQLHDSGVLTDEEFTAAKAKALGI